MTNDELVQLLLDEGYNSGWVIAGEELILWEHDTDPPAPLTRPEATNETPTAD